MSAIDPQTVLPPTRTERDYRARSGVDWFFFFVCGLGSVLGVGGVVVASVAWAVCGLVLVLAGLAYFGLERED